MRRFFSISILLFLLLLDSQALKAGDTEIWGALLVATNNPEVKPLPPALRSHATQMKKIFGYPYFELLGQSTRYFSDSEDQWLIPGGAFSVRTVIKPLKNNSYPVSLQLFQDKKELVQTEARLGPGSPLFIRGPQYGQGQLFIVIVVR